MNLKAICAAYLKGRCKLKIFDIYQWPLLARKAQILAAPTLIKELPRPARRVIGDLSDRDRVLILLDLKAEGSSNG
jgi:circadian clock protein KaiB